LVVSRFKPDLIFVFNPLGLSGLLLERLHRPRNRPIVVHDIFDEWFLYAYQHDAWFLLKNLEVRTPFNRLVRDSIARIGGWFLPSEPRPLALSRSYFRSQFLKERFIAAGQREAAGAPVIYHGIELSSDPPDEAEATGRGREIAILFVGRLCREKGMFTRWNCITSPDKAMSA
jgi:glycosyltransferase involved in cell wall biosynthesis